MNDEFIATRWVYKEDVDDFTGPIHFHIDRMTSPFYDGVKFAVRLGDHECVTSEGERIFEPLPSSRTDEFYKLCRFDTFEQAAEILKAAKIKYRR